jgi:hypothetical protein
MHRTHAALRGACLAALLAVTAVEPGSLAADRPQAVEADEAMTLDPAPLAPDGPTVASMAIYPGKPFPTLEVQALRPGSPSPGPLKLGGDLRHRTVVLFYLWLNHAISEETYLEIQRLLDSQPRDKVSLYPVVELGERYEVTELRERMRLLGITRPVILDEDHRIRFAVNFHDAPNLTLIHSDGNLAFVGARSLKHPVHGEITAADSILASIAGRRPPTKQIWRYHPASDRIGERYTDLTLRSYDTGEDLRISDYVEPGKLTALFYWSPECRFSRSMLPAVTVAQKAFAPRYLNLIAIARDGSDKAIRDLAEQHGLTVPIVRSPGGRFASTYRIISTPTIILIRPDGVVDSVYTSGNVNLFPVLNTKVKSLVIDPAAAGGSSR